MPSLLRSLSAVAALALVLACSASARADIPPMGPDGGPPTDEQVRQWQAGKAEWMARMQAQRTEQAKRRGCAGREALLGAVSGGAIVLAASAMRRRRRAATT